MNDIEAMRKKLIQSAKYKIQQKYEGKESHIIKAINLLDDIDATANILTEQLKEWHAMNFPELEKNCKDTDEYLALVSELGAKENFTTQKIVKIIDDKERAQQIAEEAKKSIGSKAGEKDMAEIKSLALNCRNMKMQRDHMATYIEESMEQELPNFTKIAGPIIGAKILSKAGSKKKLAFMPSSTIQVIGAEKAMFLHIKKGIKSPKYGYLYQHPLVKAARRDNKGRLARTIAAKLAIAAKQDYFGGKKDTSEMQNDIDKRVEELSKRKESMKKYPEERSFSPAREFTQRREPREERVRPMERKPEAKQFTERRFQDAQRTSQRKEKSGFKKPMGNYRDRKKAEFYRDRESRAPGKPFVNTRENNPEQRGPKIETFQRKDRPFTENRERPKAFEQRQEHTRDKPYQKRDEKSGSFGKPKKPFKKHGKPSDFGKKFKKKY